MSEPYSEKTGMPKFGDIVRKEGKRESGIVLDIVDITDEISRQYGDCYVAWTHVDKYSGRSTFTRVYEWSANLTLVARAKAVSNE